MCLLKKPKFVSEDDWNKISKLNIGVKSALTGALNYTIPMARTKVVSTVNKYRSKKKYYKKLYLSKLRKIDVEVTVTEYKHESPLKKFIELYHKDPPDFSMRMCAPKPQLKSDYSIPPNYVPSYDAAWLVGKGEMCLSAQDEVEQGFESYEDYRSRKLNDETLALFNEFFIKPCSMEGIPKPNTDDNDGGNK